MKKDTPVPTRKDPVCGMPLSQRTAAFELQRAEKTYYFCAAVCRDAFEADPEKYLSRREGGTKTTDKRRHGHDWPSSQVAGMGDFPPSLQENTAFRSK